MESPDLPGGAGAKRQMLHLNRRLEAYMNRVRLLEEENGLLEEELRAARRGGRGAGTLRRSLEEELRRARAEAAAAWRDGLLTELEVGRMAEELRALDLRSRREAEAAAAAEAELERGRRALQVEFGAQEELRQWAAHLELQARLLVQTHRDDVARLEAERAPPPRPPARRADRTPDLLQLGREVSCWAAGAWQEAEEAHRGQLARLEEALHQTRGSLAQAGQEGHENQLKLRALEEEVTSALEVQKHLEETAARRSDEHQQEVRRLQDHLEALGAEREQTGRQIGRLVLQNRGLVQATTSLGLEVATYRALLDGEGFRRDVRPSNQPKITSTADAVFSPRGVKTNHQILSGRHKATPFRSALTSAAPTCHGKPAAPEAAARETSQHKIQRMESFRPQEVQGEEPPSASDEQEPPAGSSGVEELQNKAGPPVESPVVESVAGHQVLGSETSFSGDYLQSHSVAPSHVGAPGDRCGVSGKSKKVYFRGVAEQEEARPADTWPKKPEDDYSDSETEAMLEHTSESRTSSPESECVSEELVTEFNLDENAAEIRQKLRSSTVGGNKTDADDKLYPDGEEMDTWDSVMERKVHLGTGEPTKSDEGERQHAEPEEDISEHKKGDLMQQGGNVTSSPTVSKQVDEERERADRASDRDEEDEDDSQNVSVSWRTELESDSYAQDNTLADTRPLIRYKSDETDANVHLDESESSEGEQDGRARETGMGTWTEDKAKRFGTMEDLCEEIEGEMMDEPYSLAYVQTEETDVGHGSVAGEQPRPASDAGNAERKVAEQNEKLSVAETEKPIKPVNIDDDVELDTDRVVEEELASCTTDRFGAQFEERHLIEESEVTAREVTKTEHAKETKTEQIHSVQSEDNVPSSTITNQASGNVHSTASSVETDPTDTVVEWDVQHGDGDSEDTPGTREEDSELCASVKTHTDATEIQAGFTDQLFTDTEEMKISEMAADQKNNPDAADCTDGTEAILTATKISREELVKRHQQQQPQLHHVEDSVESQEESAQGIEHSHEVSDNVQQAQPGNIVETSKESEVPSSQELFQKLQQPQLDDIVETSRTCPDQPVGDVADNLELSSNPQKSPPYDQSGTSEESEDELVEAAAGGQKLVGFLQQPPGDESMEAALKRSQDQPGEDHEPSSSFDSQSDHLQDKFKEVEQKDVLLEAFGKSEEDLAEDVAYREDFPESPETAEREVLVKPTEDCEIQDRETSGQKRYLEARSYGESEEMHRDEPLEAFPDTRNIFALEEATDSKLSDFIPSGGKSDFWVTSLEGGATFQPEDNTAATLTNPNTGFAGNAIWGSAQNVVNGNSKAETDLPEPQAAAGDEKEGNAEVKHVQSRSVVEGEPIHSEESEVDGESWSSEE